MSLENAPDKHNYLSQYEKFALQLFDEADQLFTIRQVEQEYKTLDVRSMFLKLTDDDLSLIGPLLESYYALDAPEYVEIRVDGCNPFNVEDAGKALLAIRMEYTGFDDKEVEYYYSVKINYPNEDQQIVAYKSVDIDVEEKLCVKAPIEYMEQRGLLAMMSALKNTTSYEGGRHRRSEDE